jgi:hypothetical protein
MLILALLAGMHLVLWLTHKRLCNMMLTVSLFVIVYSVLWMSVLDLELNAVRSEGTYGSDETEYYAEMTAIVRGETVPGLHPAPGFLEFGSSVLRSSPTQDAIWIRIANILVYSLTVNLVFVIAFSRFEALLEGGTAGSRHGTRRRFLILFIFCCCNGIVIWTVLRVLKESLFMGVLALAFYVAYLSARSRHFLLRAALLVCMLPIGSFLANLRPGSEYLPLLVLAGAFVTERAMHARSAEKKRQKSPRPSVAVMSIGCLGFLLCTVLSYRLLWPQLEARIRYVLLYRQLFGNFFSDTFTSSLVAQGAWGYVLGFLRFVLGPGPIRSAQQIISGNVFMVSVGTGDMLIFLGSLQWWLTLAIGAVGLARGGRKSVRSLLHEFDFVLASLFFIATYTFVYAGTGDTRHRAVLYVLAVPVLLCLWPDVAAKRVHHQDTPRLTPYPHPGHGPGSEQTANGGIVRG